MYCMFSSQGSVQSAAGSSVLRSAQPLCNHLTVLTAWKTSGCVAVCAAQLVHGGCTCFSVKTAANMAKELGTAL